MKRSTIILIISIALIGLFLGEINEATGNLFEPIKPQYTCTETDDGIDYYTKGTATYGPSTATDICLDEQTLKEAYCISTGISFRSTYTCPNSCQDGACIEKETIPAPKEVICTDSDEGKNYYEQGTANDGTFSTTDMCLVQCGAFITIHEAYCDVNGVTKEETFQCEYGCATDESGSVLGKCNGDGTILTCEDSDELDYYIKGRVIAGDFFKEDFCCESDNQLFEWYCKDNKFNFEAYTCPNSCQDGACVKKEIIPAPKEVICTDSDGGLDYYVKGYVKTDDVYQPITYDSCYSDIYPENIAGKNFLEERFCDNGKLNTQVYTCPDSCQDGACVEKVEIPSTPKEEPICEVETYTGSWHTAYCTETKCNPGDKLTGCNRETTGTWFWRKTVYQEVCQTVCE